jgi:RsiW-degrading membrane proteinase PrsW (M82 family)
MDRLETIVLAGAAPALVMLLYATLKVRGGLFSPILWAALLCGTGVCLPALTLETAGIALRGMLHLSPTAATAVLDFGFVGPAEEGGKLVIILALVELGGGSYSARRALLAAIGVGMGFALLENLYFLVHARNVMALAIARASTALPVHLLLAMVLGSMVVRARIYPHHGGVLIGIGFLLAAFLHGGYDFLLSNPFHDPGASYLPIRLGGLLAVVAFSRVLPLAQAADEARGDEWPPPMRVGCFCASLLALPWPILMLGVAIKLRDPGARLIAVFPTLIVLDLFRSGFARARPTEGHRRLLAYKPGF